MKEKLKERKGVTLIALVITIIVLLILAGVSIAMLSGDNGLLTKAEKAKEETEIADIIERAKVDILGVQSNNKGDITQKQLDETLAKYGTVSGEGENKILTTNKGYIIKVSDIYSGTIAVGKIVAEDVLKTNSTATEAKDKSPYVKYNGLDCRVLYNDETHGIQIITAESVEDVKMGANDEMVTPDDFEYTGTVSVNDNYKKAVASYNNAVDNLNNKAKTYMDKKGIATDARCLGSVATLSSDYKFKGDTSGIQDFPTSSGYKYIENIGLQKKCKKYDTNYLEDKNKIVELRIYNRNKQVWLASRKIDYTTRDISLSLYYMSNLSHYDTSLIYASSDTSNVITSGYGRSYGFRPVFLISPNATISGGDGSSENPYIIK